MVRGKQSVPKSRHRSSKLNVINPTCAGIDLGSREHWVCVPPEANESNIRSFGCTTPDLLVLADWLASCGVTTVAMESTGVEWIPLFQILSERKFQLFLVNAKSLDSDEFTVT